jgi:hypothetical protein
MNLHLVMRWSYLLAWLFGALAVVLRVVERIRGTALSSLPASTRGMLMFAGFLFVASMATAAYEQATRTQPEEKPKAKAAGA